MTKWTKDETGWVRVIKSGDLESVEHVTTAELATYEKQFHKELRGVDGQERLNRLVASRVLGPPTDYVESLETRIHWLLDHFNHWAEDGTFTFPDGETWRRTEAK